MLAAGGVSLEEVADDSGTPLCVYDERETHEGLMGGETIPPPRVPAGAAGTG